MNTRWTLVLIAALVVVVAIVMLGAQAPTEDSLTQTYISKTKAFSIRLPEGYTAREEASEVTFTIPEVVATGTNLSTDTHVSVEQILNVQTCSATLFIDQQVAAHTVIDAGVTYSVASTTGAGAGNRYEETVYALPNSNPCTAVRYLVHYGVIENYPPGAVREFDREALLAEFDSIRRSLTLQAGTIR